MATCAAQSTFPAIEHEVTRWTRSLLEDGYCIIPDVIDRATIEALDRDLEVDFDETPFCAGKFYGEQARRVQAEAEARAATTRFLGSGSAYSPLPPGK